VSVDIPALMGALDRARVRCILVGGGAAIAHGASRLTNDIDIVYARDPENVRRLVAALLPVEPYPRGAPPGLPFRWDERTVRNGLNFTLDTKVGPIDLLGEIAGGGGFEQLLPHTIELALFGSRIACLTLSKLIETKRAAGRPKDFEAIAELELILDQGEGPRRD
jgi:hypothetical protein